MRKLVLYRLSTKELSEEFDTLTSERIALAIEELNVEKINNVIEHLSWYIKNEEVK